MKWPFIIATLLIIGGTFGLAFYMRQRPLGGLLPGGKAAGRSASDFDPLQLRIGERVEMEHTRNPRIAREIAMDHLAEDPIYYTKLCSVWPDESGCELL